MLENLLKKEFILHYGVIGWTLLPKLENSKFVVYMKDLFLNLFILKLKQICSALAFSKDPVHQKAFAVFLSGLVPYFD